MSAISAGNETDRVNVEAEESVEADETLEGVTSEQVRHATEETRAEGEPIPPEPGESE